MELSRSKYYQWRDRYGKANEHNVLIPRDHWLEQWEKDAIIEFHHKFPLEGYRRLTFMMLDRDIVAVSPSSTYRVLNGAGLLDSWKPKPSFKGTGFVQPLAPHEHWHVDVSYINVSGTFFYLCSLLDGCSRAIVHWELREAMTEADVEIILQRGLEKYPHAKPRIISDNGPQFMARDFKEFIRIAGLTHVRTSPYYPQSNGKIERWHKSLKRDCIRPGVPLNLQDARRLVTRFVEHYNTVRLHSAIGYITPADKLAGKEEAIFAARDQKLLQARETRKAKRNQSNHTHSLAATLTFSN
jgi:putative transposase